MAIGRSIPVLSAAIHELRHFARVLGRTLLFVYVPIVIVLVFWHFPYDTDSATPDTPVAESAGASSSGFYEVAYSKTDNRKRGLDYETTAAEAAEASNIKGQIRDLVKRYNLERQSVLDVGSGRGYLQDMVADYTGLDISPTVASKYHKPFVVGSATDMPFADNTFDAAWTVWVIEHIPQPEKAFAEMRRVIKPGGHLFVFGAWNCPPWFADGFDVRPYEDFTLAGKFVKASIPLRQMELFDSAHRIPTRLMRWASYTAAGESAKLHYRRLRPNYDVYWRPDSDAAISLDSYEAMLWFRSRGDECLSCESAAREIVRAQGPLEIRIGKKSR